MESTNVAYLEKGSNARRIQGTAEINGHDGTYQLDVSDDESSTDTFAIRLSNGYSAWGHLKSGHIEIRTRCQNDKDTQGGNHKNDDHEDKD